MSLAAATMVRSFDFESRTWTMRPPNVMAVGMFEDYLNRHMVAETNRYYGGTQGYREALDLTLAKVHRRVYEWKTEAMLECLGAERHMRELVLILLRQEAKDTPEALGKLDAEFMDRLTKNEAWAKAIDAAWEFVLRPNFHAPQAGAAGEVSGSAK
jgi:hypothetical protein